jgi:hypothetical protein
MAYQQGNQAIFRLPQEVWAQIGDCVSNTFQLLNINATNTVKLGNRQSINALTLLSRHFNTLCEPILYTKYHFKMASRLVRLPTREISPGFAATRHIHIDTNTNPRYLSDGSDGLDLLLLDTVKAYAMRRLLQSLAEAKDLSSFWSVVHCISQVRCS